MVDFLNKANIKDCIGSENWVAVKIVLKEVSYMNGPTKFVDWLLQMGYLDKEDISSDGVEIAKDMNKVKEVAPKFYNMLMCMCDCGERVSTS